MSTKAVVRARISAARAALSSSQREAARTAIRQRVLARCTLPAGATIAAYEPMRTEPGSTELLAALTGNGYRVIVPRTLPDRDLDWQLWQSSISLGPAAIGSASLVLVPAFAVSRTGDRLGRGGGSYDRALARVAPDTPVAALLYPDELLDTVPTDPWDRPVTAAVRPSGWLDLTPAGRRNSP